MLSEIPVVGSVAITSNWTAVAGPAVVVKRPLLESILTLGGLGFVLQVTESVILICCPLAVPVATNCSLLP
jgi:hypothetical protein